MEKDILVLVKLSNKEIFVTAVEKYESSYIEIFSDSTNPPDKWLTIKFIKDSINKIEKLINTKINEVSIIFDATSKAEIKQKIINETISGLNNQKITENDFLNAQKKVEKYYTDTNSKDEVPILFQPFQFTLIDESLKHTKKYFELPIGIVANKLEILFSVTTIKKAYYDHITNICNDAELKISQIYSSSNASPFILENNRKEDYSVTLEVEKNYSNLIITNNGVTIVTESLEFNYRDLNKKIAEEFKVSKKIVDELIITEGIITKDITQLNKIIFQKKNISIKAAQLTSLIKSFIKTLIKEIDDFIKFKHSLLKNYTLNIIGRIEKIEKIDEYCKSILINNKIIVNSRPINYLLSEYNNRTIFGLLKMIENTKRITNIDVKTLVINTKPDIMSQNISKGWLKQHKKQQLMLLNK